MEKGAENAAGRSAVRGGRGGLCRQFLGEAHRLFLGLRTSAVRLAITERRVPEAVGGNRFDDVDGVVTRRLRTRRDVSVLVHFAVIALAGASEQEVVNVPDGNPSSPHA